VAILNLPRKKVRIHAVGLDVDGPIRNTGLHAFEAFCKTVEQLGGVRPELHSFVRDYRSGWGKEHYIGQCGILDLPSHEVRDAYRNNLRPRHEHVPPCEDLLQFLGHSKQCGLKLFVVSGDNHERLLAWFDTHNLHVHFHSVQGSSNDKIDALRETCENIGIDPCDAAYVGDWGLDMRAALEVGLVPIGITRGCETRGALLESGAAYVVDTLLELQGLIH
jgi:phosphoglycolate phosphatase-like HAD superfamily hydrolase